MPKRDFRLAGALDLARNARGTSGWTECRIIETLSSIPYVPT